MAASQVRVPETEIAEFCRRNGVRRFSFFGSILTERFSDTSDIDVLVEFKPGRPVGYLRMAAMERELSTLFGRKIDLRTPDELSRYFRDEVMKAAQVQYVGE
ncbi:DNA polymerase beta domain protein region [Candidatus Sulfopaludibacter sp. SbA6]|nr:DNA polymerase beta domain protein region [Candidatus Sulfopaludibacter sp. SbA6]